MGIPDLEQAVDSLRSELLAAKANGKLDGVLKQLQGQDKRAIADVFKSKEGQLLKQANMAIETFKKIGEKWPDIKKIIDKGKVDLADINNIQKILKNEVSGGFFTKLSQNFGVATKPFPGLEPNTIIDRLFVVLQDDVTTEQVTPQKTESIPPGHEIADSVLKTFSSNFEKLYKFAQTGASATNKGITGTTTTTPTKGTASQSRDTKETTPTTTTTGTENVPGLMGQPYDQDVIKDISQKLNSKPEQINKILQALLGAGYKLEKA